MKKHNGWIVLLVLLTLGLTAFFVQAAPAAQPGSGPYPPPATQRPLGPSAATPTQPPYPPPQAPTAVTPFPTLRPSTPVPTPAPSEAALAAQAHLAQRAGIPAAALVVVTDHSAHYPNLDRSFQVVTLLDTRPAGRFYNLLVDLDSGQVIEDTESIWAAEEQAKAAKYGKLQPALYERLQGMRDDETVTVTIWAAAGPGQRLAELETVAQTALAAKYPEARAALERRSKVMDVGDPALAKRIEVEYVAWINAGMSRRVQPLVKALEAQGATVRTSDGLPAVTVSLTKRAILLLAQRDDVGTIYLAEGGEFILALNSAVPTNLAPVVWARGYDGTGASIAILETGNVDFTSNTANCPAGSNNCFRHPGATRTALYREYWHTTLVASAAASDHSTYRGMAPGATIMSAGMTGVTRQDGIDALLWAINQGADVINVSGGWYVPTIQMDVVDRAFDHYARSRYKMVVVAAGNQSSSPSYYVISPARGWNVLSVGAYDDHNNATWAGDSMAGFSCWVNPDSPSHDHEKPEVAAPGVSITGIGMDGNLVTDPNLNSGTSFAAPQVAGLSALLIHRNSALRVWPEASRAIIMASATHNVDGPTGIPAGQDLRDGAGGINATLADTVAQNWNLSAVNPCAGSCWWGILINNTDFPVGTYLYRYFTANRGDFVRIAISWWSHADCPSVSNCNYDRLDTDLDLGVHDPDGQQVSGAWSASWDNNYELIEFVAPKTGTYRIAVYKARANEPSNYLGIAVVRLRRIYLPIVLKNFQ